jgi:glycosyltransferase involved in cell wall biosynthesis
MQSWKEKHRQEKHRQEKKHKHESESEWTYRLWTERELTEENIGDSCETQIDLCKEYCGVADIARLEILFKYGGIFVDADSICIEPINDTLLENTGFAAFENESVRPGLIANGTMGFVPGHPLLRDMLAEIASGALDADIPRMRAWQVLGPVLLTRFLETGNYPDMCVYPSHLFTPQHFEPAAKKYMGHHKVYAYQCWGTSNQNYMEIERMNAKRDPHYFEQPNTSLWVSVLVSSYNTPRIFLQECFASLRAQRGYFGMELVWINDGSTAESSRELEDEIALLEKTARFCKIVYVRTFENRGVAMAMNTGISICSHDLVVKMDSDDIMLPDRIETQMKYMRENPDCMLCGGQIAMFRSNRDNNKFPVGKTNHTARINMTDLLAATKESSTHTSVNAAWFMNHPTICFRRTAMLELTGPNGNYIYDPDPELRVVHDYDMLIRFIMKYGEVHNLPEVLLMYRLHDGQLTCGHDQNSGVMQKIRKKYIA